MKVVQPRMSCQIHTNNLFNTTQPNQIPISKANKLIQFLQSQPNITLRDELRGEISFNQFPKAILKNDKLKKIISPNKTLQFIKQVEKNQINQPYFTKKINVKERKGFFSPKATKASKQNNETSNPIFISMQLTKENFRPYKSPLGHLRKEIKFENELVQSQKQINFNKLTTQCPQFLKRMAKSTKNIQLSSEQNQIKIEDFVLFKTLGQGTFGQVFAAFHKQSGSLHTIKRYKKQIIKSHELETKFIHDIKVQMRMNHPHIVKLYGFFDDMIYFYMIFEYMESGNLALTIEEKGGRLPEVEVLRKIYEINDALLYLHSRNLVHRDIKPSSVLTCLNVCKLCDTQWLQQNSNVPHHITLCKELDYMPPEAIEGKQITAEFDIWGLGLIAYELLKGKKLIQGNTQKILIRKIITLKKQLIDIMIPKQCSESLRNLILSSLQPVPSKRLTSNEINKIKIQRQMEWSKNNIINKYTVFGQKSLSVSQKLIASQQRDPQKMV